MATQHRHNGESNQFPGQILPGRIHHQADEPSDIGVNCTPPLSPPTWPPITQIPVTKPPPMGQPIAWIRERRWRPFWTALFLVVTGNTAGHLYLQSWHWVAPGRGASGATLFAAVTAVFFVVVCWREYWSRHADVIGIVLPSVIGGIIALIAWLADMPGPETWVPTPMLLSFFSEGELCFLPLTTAGQIWLLSRIYLMPDRVPF